jgi:predicted ribosomally synthesized peptide with SipW-like signal peptide
MNIKIVGSSIVIAMALAVMAGGTVAFFNDTQTSAGNTFTAGTIDLEIDNTCHYNGGACPYPDSTWALTDLVNGVHKFFNFGDIKPGAWGENTISLHLTSNAAWAWLKIKVAGNAENGCNEPELRAEPACASNENGELAAKLNYIIWQDSDCSNTINNGEHIFKQPGLISACDTWMLNYSGQAASPLQPTNASAPYCVGIAWCAGNWIPGSTPQIGSWNCDGSAIGNEAQSDSLKLDLEFAVVQSRHNPNASGAPVCQ